MRSRKSLPKRAAWATTAALALSLALARLHPFGDAQMFAARRTELPQLPDSIPAEARLVLAMDCADCHSVPARAPLYGRFAPASWLLERDILDARSHLNFSAWDSYSPERQQVLLAEIEQQVKGGHMPPAQYLLVHGDARPDASDIAALIAWARTSPPRDGQGEPAHGAQLPARLEAGGSAEGAKRIRFAAQGPEHAGTISARDGFSAPDPARGQDLFNRRCTGCHALTENREGPQLAGVYGRASASLPGFPYSAALTAARLTWNEETLDRWLTDPDGFVSGVNMDFRMPKAQERVDIIAYLKTLSR